MSVRKETPCNYGECPYGAEYWSTCEWYCGEEEPQDIPDIDEDEEYLIDCLDEKAEPPEELSYPKEFWEDILKRKETAKC